MERERERQHSRSFTKLLGLTGPVLVSAKSEPGLNLPLRFATQRHQINNFTLKQQWKGEINGMRRDGELNVILEDTGYNNVIRNGRHEGDNDKREKKIVAER